MSLINAMSRSPSGAAFDLSSLILFLIENSRSRTSISSSCSTMINPVKAQVKQQHDNVFFFMLYLSNSPDLRIPSPKFDASYLLAVHTFRAPKALASLAFPAAWKVVNIHLLPRQLLSYVLPRPIQHPQQPSFAANRDENHWVLSRIDDELWQSMHEISYY